MIRRGNRDKPVPSAGYIINDRIRAREVRLILTDGQNIGIVSLDEALRMAQEQETDLVQISESSDGETVVAKLMDFGRFLYKKKKETADAKKKQKTIQIKELKMRPRIEGGDYEIRLKRAKEFLSEGKRVKFTLQFRGREIATMGKVGPEFFGRISKDVKEMDLGQVVEEIAVRGGPFYSKVFYLKGK
ncbi:translation initiation factor IF-3 [bacterium]|nr:translation initiation factor IF-3 [bacterium]